MFTTIINDCRDDNARGRQESRVASLLKTNVSFVGVHSDLEAGMHLIDILDATNGQEGLILVNVAPRGGHATKWENGTPFGYFYVGSTLVVASVDGFVLSAVKKLGILKEFFLLDTHSSAEAMANAGFITPTEAEHIPVSQFRSFDFTPRAGIFLLTGNHLPSEPYNLSQIPDLPFATWHIDNFGNCKTTLTKNDIGTETMTTRYGTLPFYAQLRSVPDDASALVEGSSGYDGTRFLELMTQRHSFAETHRVRIGDDIFTEASYFTEATT